MQAFKNFCSWPGWLVCFDGDYFLFGVFGLSGKCPSLSACHLLQLKCYCRKWANSMLPTKVRLVKAMVFPVVMNGCELDCEEGWAWKNSCFWTLVMETLESPLDCKDIQPVHSEGDQPFDCSGRNDAKAETPVLWHPNVKSWLIGKDTDSERDCGQEEKGTA